MEMRQDPPEHRSDARSDVGESQQAALLIDFDNVTMGIRSNLGQELRNLLNSDVIRGKVAVQRAYADWRRYPQYIVPLSEASIDLIFAPAYGSSKKNATDIRLAIDALELVFVRPEIKTFILMSGDSDFSSLVLKLKEYGRYVIGVGIQESSSDLLVQNCDEYYSYTSLSGLSKTSDLQIESHDPWLLVGKAVERMVERGDTMRSDRLKQVMLEIDPSFNEKEHGFNKFNRFVVEAASRGLVSIQKMENGQYGVAPGAGTPAKSAAAPRGREAPRKREAKAESRRSRGPREKEAQPSSKAAGERSTARARPKLTMKRALELLDRALGNLLDDESASVRDSDVKRRILELDQAFDEGELGFSKFSKFLQAAEEQGAIELNRGPNGNYHVGRPKRGARRRKAAQAAAPAEKSAAEKSAAEKSAAEKESTVKRLARFLFGGAEEPSAGQAKAAAETKAGQEAKRREAEAKKSARARSPESRGPTAERRREETRRPKKGEREPRGGGADAREARGRQEGRAGGSSRAREPAPRRGKRREEGRAAGRRGGERRERRDDRGSRGPREKRRAERPSASPPDTVAAEAEADVAAAAAEAKPEPTPEPTTAAESAAPVTRDSDAAGTPSKPDAVEGPKTSGVTPAPLPGAPRATIRGRWGTRGRYRPPPAPPPLFEGQSKPRGEKSGTGPPPAATDDARSIVSHLTGYSGVGERTAETLVDAFGADTLRVLDEEPERVREILPGSRAERVLEARRKEREAGDA